MRIDAGLRVPRGGIVVRAPSWGIVASATVNGARVPVKPDGELILRRLPAVVILRR